MILLFCFYLFGQSILFYIKETNLGIFLEFLDLPTILSGSSQSGQDEMVGRHLSDHDELIGTLMSYILAGAEVYSGKYHGTQCGKNMPNNPKQCKLCHKPKLNT